MGQVFRLVLDVCDMDSHTTPLLLSRDMCESNKITYHAFKIKF